MKQITLSIPEPCHEGWDNMTPSEKGRFCSSCQKEVVDFTGMTDDELFAFFAQKNKGSVCGRTHVGQLDTPIAKPVVHKKKKFWYLQYAASLLLLLTKPGGAKAQAKQPVTVAPQTRNTDILMGDTIVAAAPQPVTKVLQGTIENEEGEPIVNASVIIKGHSHGVATDKEGHYQVRVKQKDIVTFSAVGYETQTIVVNEKDLSITTVLKTSRSMLEGEIVVVGVMSWNNDDAIGYDVPRYKSLLQVKDKANNSPLAKASITIVGNGHGKQKQALTNSQGEYLLRKIKANETYTVIITATGYQTKNILINGNQLKSGNNLKTILLEKLAITQELMGAVAVCYKPPVKESHSIDDALTGELMKPIDESNTPIKPLPQLQPNQFAPSTNINNMLVGSVRCIIARPSVPTKRKVGFLKKIFSKPGASTTQLPTNTPTPISIYPNPAKINSSIVIAFEKAPKGSYRLQLINGMGSLVQQQQITVPAEAFHFQWALGSQVAAGSYTVQVINAEGKALFSGKTIVVQ